MGMYLEPPCHEYALKCYLVYLAIPKRRLLCMKKQNLFICMQPQKVKFKFVQINMQQVSYRQSDIIIHYYYNQNLIFGFIRCPVNAWNLPKSFLKSQILQL